MNRNSAAVHAASCGLRRSSQRSSVDSANAKASRVAAAASAKCRFIARPVCPGRPGTVRGACELVQFTRSIGRMTERARRRIPDATVARLPVYLRSLLEIAGDSTTVSSERLAELAGVNAAKVRKDLSYLGSYGTRGVGYDVEYLLFQMSRELGLTQHWPVVIVGIGNLGHALANYGGFGASGLPRRRAGRRRPRQGRPAGGAAARSGRSTSSPRSCGPTTSPSASSPRRPSRRRTSPTGSSPPAITSILNFAPAVLTVPTGVSLRKVDLAVELQILSFHQQRRGPKSGGGATATATPPSRWPSATDAAARCRSTSRCTRQPPASGAAVPRGRRRQVAVGKVRGSARSRRRRCTSSRPSRSPSWTRIARRHGRPSAVRAGRGRGLPARDHRHRRSDGRRAGVRRRARPPGCGSTPPTTPSTARSRSRPASAEGRLLVTFATGGRSPALRVLAARALRGRARTGVRSPARHARRRSSRAHRAVASPTEHPGWKRALDSGMLELIREGHLAEAKERLQACLSSSSD